MSLTFSGRMYLLRNIKGGPLVLARIVIIKISLQNLKDMISSSQFLTLYAGIAFDMGMLPKHVGVVFKL